MCLDSKGTGVIRWRDTSAVLEFFKKQFGSALPKTTVYDMIAEAKEQWRKGPAATTTAIGFLAEESDVRAGGGKIGSQIRRRAGPTCPARTALSPGRDDEG